MKIMRRHFFALFFTALLPLQVAIAAAPVVDDSENFAILDDQQTDQDQSVDQGQYDTQDEEVALAQDTDDSTNKPALLEKLQSMQRELQELRGQLEIQGHQLKQLQQQQLTFYKDFDNRLRSGGQLNTAKAEPSSANTSLSIGTKNNPSASNSTIPEEPEQLTQQQSTNLINNTIAAAPARANPADEQISYLAAYDLVKNKRFDDALIAMQNFVTQYPQGGYTANAHYWLGELYMVKKNYTQAINHFEIVLKQFPNSSKAAACTLKIGYALAASGKEGEAKQRLQQVLKNYPDTPTAQLAMAKLKSLNAS